MRRPGPWHAVTIVVAAAGLTLLGALPAATAADPLPATLSGITRGDSGVSGTLTVRGQGGALAIDEDSVVATVGSATVPVDFTPGTAKKRQAMIVVDTSGSMRPRQSAAQQAALAFLEAAPADVEIGLVSFANVPFVESPPTMDRTALRRLIGALESRGETALYAGVRTAIDQMAADGDRSLVLLSDGAESVVPEGKRAETLRTLISSIGAAGVRTEAIAYETADTTDSVATVLGRLATAGGGSVTKATDAAGVTAAFTAAAQVLELQADFTLVPPAGVSGTQQVVLTGTAGGQPFRAAASTDLGAARATPTTAAAAPDDTGAGLPLPRPGLLLPIAAGLLAAGLLIGVLAIEAPSFKSRRRRRVEAIQGYALGAAGRPRATKVARSAAWSERIVNSGQRFMDRRESTSRTMALIERADLPFRAGEWLVLRVVAVVVSVALFLVVLRDVQWLGVLIGLVVGIAAPTLLLRFLAKRRSTKFEASLPDVLTLVATSLASGFSLPQALDAIARDAAEPARKEFSRALAETRIGMEVADALEHMADRIGSESMSWTAMAINIQRQVGGNLAETLRTTAKTLRERESLKRQVRALSAEGRLSAYILIGLPIGVFFYSLMVNFEYISMLWTTLPGIVMGIGGIISLIVGTLWMRKVVEIEV